jgi:hypothetical protein
MMLVKLNLYAMFLDELLTSTHDFWLARTSDAYVFICHVSVVMDLSIDWNLKINWCQFYGIHMLILGSLLLYSICS